MKLLYTIRNSVLCILFLTATLLPGCTKITDDDIPAYISIDSISIESQALQGTASHKIVDAWVYSDNGLVGAFELPVTFPVLKSGNVQLNIYPGIKMNGMAETRVPYPFYNPIALPANLSPEQVSSLGNLKTTYKSSTVFKWIEDFETQNFTMDKVAKSDYAFSWYSDESAIFTYPGENNNHSARVVIDNDSSYFEVVSHDSFKLPTDGHEVFLEMNYKTNNAFAVGLYINGSTVRQLPVVVVTPTQSWNKIYINFTPTVINNSDARTFRVFISMNKASNVDKAELMVDNIKLLHL